MRREPLNRGEAASRPADSSAFEAGPYRGMIKTRYRDSLFLRALSDPDQLLKSTGAEVLLDGRNKVVAVETVFAAGEKRKIVVKKFALRGVNRLKTLIQPSKAAKAWRGASALEDRKIGTPAPIAYFEKKKNGFVEEAYFIAERITGYDEIRGHFLNPRPEVLESLLPALARFLAACQEAGILHRDLSDGNVLVCRGAAANWAFLLLDTNRIRVRRRISRFVKIKNLIRLGVPRTHQKDFLRAYLGEAGFKPWRRLWYRIAKNMYACYVRLKKALRLRKLAGKLRIQ